MKTRLSDPKTLCPKHDQNENHVNVQSVPMHTGYWSRCLYNKINVTETCVTYDNHHNNKTPPKSHPDTVVIILQRPNRWLMKQLKRWWSSTRTFRSPSWPLMRPLRPTASISASLGQPLWEPPTVSVVIYSFGKKQTFVRMVAQIQIQTSGRVLSVIYLWMFVREVRSSEP